MDNSKRINLNHLNKSQINAGVNNLILNEQIETDTDIKKHGHNNTYILKNKNISNNIYNDMNNNTVNDNTDTIEKKKELNSVKENNLNYKFLLNNNNNIYVNNNIDSKSIDIENNSKDTNFYNSSMNPTSSEEYNKSSSDNDKVSKLNNTIVENEINGKNSNLYSKMKKNSCDYFNSINEENESNNNNNNTTVIVNNENGINNNVDGISNYYNCINKDLNNNINGNIVKEEKHIEKNYKVLNGNGYDTANAEDQWKDDKQKSEHKHKIVNETYNKVENNKSEIDLSNNNDSSNKNKDIINKEVLFENSNSLRDDFDDNNENENTSSYMSNSNVNFNNKDDTDNLNNDLNNKSNTFDINENKKKEKLSVQQYDASVKRRKIIVMEENENNQEEKISDAETKKMDTEKSESKSITNNSEKEKNSTEESALSKNNADSVERGTYLKDKLELLLTETKRYTEKLSGQRLKVNVQSKGNKTRRCALSEKEEDFMLLKEANEEDETIILKQPANINGVMKPYQIEGLNWLYQLYRFKINGILADEMGLGKTLQTISLLCYLRFNKNIKRKSIIICPRSTLDNWYEEIKKWCNELKAFKYYGNKDQRKELNKKVLHTDYDVLLTTYEIVIKDKSALYDIEWFFLIIDEAHRIKNEKSVLSSSVRFLKSENRLLLTGTPLHNNLKELWSLLNFLMPKIFDNSEEFDNLFNISKISTNDNKQSEIITQLHTILKPFMLRRLKVEVEQSLPPKREIYIFVGMSKLQKKLYSDILSKNIDVINAMTGSKNQMLNILMQLRKCCNHPYLFDGIEEPPYIEGNHLIETSGKMSLLDKLLPRLKKENSRVLLFSQMTRLLDIIDDYCRWKNYEYLRIDGSTPGDERQVRINQFNEPNSKYFIFLLSTRAGGIGINLTSADIVILFDSDYNPQMDIQAMDRAHRIGQKKRVIVYRFVTQNSVEEKIVERAAKKLKLDSLIIQKGKLNLSSNKENNKQELHDILNFGAPEVYKTQDVSSISDEDIDIILADAEKRTMEIENKLKNLENIFDLTNISLDGGLNMYNNLTKEDSSEETSDEEDSNSIEDSSTTNLDNNKKKKKINKIRSTIKKFLKNNKKNITFLDLGERKSKWKVINSESNRSIKKKLSLHGWKAEAKGGHDFQFFNNERLDELEKIEEKWNNYHKNEEKIKDIIEEQSEQEDFKKIVTLNEFLDTHAKNIYEIISLINPNLLDDKNAEEDDDNNDNNNNNNNGNNKDTSCFKKKIISLLESKKKMNIVKFKDKNVKNCYNYLTNFIRKHIAESNNESSNNKKMKKGKKIKKKIEDDISNIDIDKIKLEKQELLQEGFSKWNKAEFNKLMNGLIIYGSDDIEFIYEKYFSKSKKSLEDVKIYLKAFFKKYEQIKGGVRLMEKIRKSDLQKKIVQEENDMIANFVEKQLSEGVDTIEKLKLPSNLPYEDFDKNEDVLSLPKKTKEEENKINLNEEDISYYDQENKILLWLLYQQGVVQIKSIHILAPYYWPDAYNFFRFASTSLGKIEYRCRLIVDAIVDLNKKNSKSANNKERKKL